MKSPLISLETKRAARGVGLLAVFFFVLWLGVRAIDTNDRTLLSLYVIFTAVGLAAIMTWVWKDQA